MFNAPIRKEHWFGISLVIAGLATPHIPWLLGVSGDNHNALDSTAIIWLVIINCCLLSQHILNNKTVQTALQGVGPNALVLWREIWKMIFITSAILIIPIIGNAININMPEKISASEFETRILDKVEDGRKDFLLSQYSKADNEYVLKENNFC